MSDATQLVTQATATDTEVGVAENDSQPLTLRDLLAGHGPYFGESTPDDDVLFGRLEGFGIAVWSLSSAVQREYACQLWIESLKQQTFGIPNPRRLVEEAVKAGRKLSVHTDAEGVHTPIHVDELLELQDQPTDWIVPGYAARGELAVFAGAPKVGKTTLLAQFAVAVARGDEILERKTAQTKVLWIDLEQSERRTAGVFRRLSAAGLPIYVCSDSTVRFDVEAFAKTHDVGLIIIDSLSKCWDVTDENDAAQVTVALQALRSLATTTNAAVVLVHHSRKGGGQDGEDVRGSSAITAMVDVAVSMKRRGKGTSRVLQAISRDEQTPQELVVALENGLYASLGSEQDVHLREQRNAVLGAIVQEPVTVTELAEATGLKSGTVRPTCTELYKEGLIHREGTGKAGDAYRYSEVGG